MVILTIVVLCCNGSCMTIIGYSISSGEARNSKDKVAKSAKVVVNASVRRRLTNGF